MSPTYFVFGLSALKSRPIRSGALAAAGSGGAVRFLVHRPYPGNQAADAKLATRIQAVHRESDGTYGAPRITAGCTAASAGARRRRASSMMTTQVARGLSLRRRARSTRRRMWSALAARDRSG